MKSLIKKYLLVPFVLVMLCNSLLPFSAFRASAAASNLIANSSLETADTANSSLPQDWFQGGWGTNTRTHGYLNTGHSGTRSVQVQITGYTSGDAKWFFRPVAVTGGSSYTFSDYYQAGIASDVVAQFDDGTGTYTYIDLGAATASTVWKQYQAVVTAPANAKNVTLFHLIAGIGSLTIDDAALTAPTAGGGTSAPPVDTANLTPNASFETVDPTNAMLPQSWYEGSYGNNTAKFTYNTTGHTGNRSVTVTMSRFVDGGANWTYSPQMVTAGQVYEFSDYYQSNVATQVLVAVNMSDGSKQYVWLGNPYSSASAWTRFYNTFTMPAGAVSAVAYQTISANGYFTADDVSFKPYVAKGFSSPMVSVTFDDGIASQYNSGLPILQKYNLSATFYIISGDLGLCNPNVSSICYMTTANVQSLQAAGQEIGSHTVDHPYLTTLTTPQVDQELGDSQASLQRMTGAPITDFAAPYGDVNLSVLTESQKYYASQRGTEAGYNDINNYNQQDLLVQDVDSGTTVAQVQNYIDYAKATNTWLILVYHDINADTSIDPGYDTTPAVFNTEMAYLKASGVPVKTIAQGIQAVTPQLGK